VCHGALDRVGHGVSCVAGHDYSEGTAGYLELAAPGSAAMRLGATSPHCATVQLSRGEQLYRDYIGPWLDQTAAVRVLDAGCGLGSVITAMCSDGREGWGVDVRGVAGLWAEVGRPADRFLVGDVTALPFPAQSFDAVIALGVVEHIGTLTGHLTLAADYRAQRQHFVDELVRITRPGGRVLLACPNKHFPLDIQHGPNDELTYAPWRSRLFERWGVNAHQTWGSYHLASYQDVREWARGRPVKALPLSGYFAFTALNRPGVPQWMGSAARTWVDRMPAAARLSPLNPYVLAEIRV